ncbi:hypothetical protein ACUUL3_01160 [Thiovibrio sp. JS02]
MAVDNINSIDRELVKVLQNREKSSVPLAASPLHTVENPVPVAIAATQNLSSAQQAALLGSSALQTLNLVPTSPAEPLLASGANTDLTTVTESEGLSPARQAALAVNEAVQNAVAGQGAGPAQEAALTVNETVQNLAAPLAISEGAIAAATVVGAGQIPAPGQGEETGPAAAAATEANPASAAVTARPAAITARETEVAGEELLTTQPAAAQPIQYGSAVAVYEVRNPSPPPAEPVPVRHDINPPLPIGRARRVDPLVLKKEWEKRKQNRSGEGGGREAAAQPLQPAAEKSIRQKVKQANDDLAASGVPLRLVLARRDTGYSIDIYNCADGSECRLEQEVLLDLNKLMTILDTLEHEDGIIVNIKT